MQSFYSWQTPQAIFLLLAVFFMWQCSIAQKFWCILRAHEIYSQLSNGVPLKSLQRFTWLFFAANVFCFVLSLILTLTRSLHNPLVDYLVIIATDAFFLISLNRFAFYLLNRDALIPLKIHQNLKALTTKRLSIIPRIRPIVITCGLLLIILALMGPEGQKTSTQLHRDPFEVVIALDLSQSMNVQDVFPTRLEAALEEIDALTRLAPHQEYALLFFTTQTFVQIPLTMDPPTVRAFLSQVSTDAMPTHGTDIPNALLAARKLFRLGDSYLSQNKVSRRILLISDGEDHSDRLESVLKVLVKDDIHVDVIGVGTSKGGQVFTAEGEPVIYKNEPVISRFEGSSLKHIAEQTDGLYQQYGIPHDAAEHLAYQWDTIQIDLAPAGIVTLKTHVRLYYVFVIPLYLIAIYLVFEPMLCHILQIRRRKKQSASTNHNS